MHSSSFRTFAEELKNPGSLGAQCPISLEFAGERKTGFCGGLVSESDFQTVVDSFVRFEIDSLDVRS
jgi:hypothetical protein